MNLSPIPIQAELPQLELSPNGPAGDVSESPMDLSEISHVEQELDRAIAELARCSERAMADGDPAGARIYADRMYTAIASRTPEHQARLTAEADQRIHDELTFAGDWAHQAGRARA